MILSIGRIGKEKSRENEVGQDLGGNFVNPLFSRKILRKLSMLFFPASSSRDFPIDPIDVNSKYFKVQTQTRK